MSITYYGRNPIEALKEKGYGYIIGARIKKESKETNRQIFGLDLKEDGQHKEISEENSRRLIVSYASKRAKKDMHNCKKRLRRLEKRLG